MQEHKYIEIEIFADTGKTKVWRVGSRRHGDLLGFIKWYGSWRQYVFEPEPDCIFNPGCMVYITDFIVRQMELRKNKDTPQSQAESEATTSPDGDLAGNITRGFQATSVAQIADATSESPNPVSGNDADGGCQ